MSRKTAQRSTMGGRVNYFFRLRLGPCSVTSNFSYCFLLYYKKYNIESIRTTGSVLSYWPAANLVNSGPCRSQLSSMPFCVITDQRQHFLQQQFYHHILLSSKWYSCKNANTKRRTWLTTYRIPAPSISF